MYNRQLRCVALGLTLSLWAVGCSALPEGDESDTKKKEEATGPTYDQAMDAMYPDALSAMKATMPQVEVEEIPGGQTNCGGLDVVDSKDASKLKASAAVRLPGDPSDKRSADTVVNEVVTHLRDKGWEIVSREPTTPPGHTDGVLKYMKKPGVSGIAEISSYPFRLTSGKISQTLNTKVITDCLRNPDWQKE